MKFFLTAFFICIFVFAENFLMSEVKEVKVPFRMQSFESKYQSEVEVYIAVQKNTNFAKSNESKFATIKALNLPIDQYAITGSGALGIRNLRVIWVIDENNIKKIVFSDSIVEALGEQSFYTEKKDRDAPSINERIATAEVIEGLPFESLEHVLYYKSKMSREKHKQDIEILEALINEKEKNT